MVRILEISAILSLVIGTTGLLANMFFLDWGNTVSLVFVILNISGLMDMVVVLWLKSRMGEDEEERHA
ncbi:MAG: hypothetical protein RBT34_04905 [Anaerolineaceae bacterium]|jgi:hypothetical protein|nr:hypothetical protein [Anaerolineaceae bacterium]